LNLPQPADSLAPDRSSSSAGPYASASVYEDIYNKPAMVYFFFFFFFLFSHDDLSLIVNRMSCCPGPVSYWCTFNVTRR
jgi:hypothetical protein